MVVSVGLHVLAFLLWRGPIPFVAPGALAPRSAAGATAGGGSLEAVSAVLPRRAEIPTPPRPVLAVDAPVVDVEEPRAEVRGPDLGLPAAGRLAGAGAGMTGHGSGGAGDGEGYVSPVPRTVIPHWDPPGSVRGMEVTVRIHVDASGRPTGRVELEPPTPDRAFNREIVERVRRMQYRPAERNGIPVAGWAEITFIF